MARKTNFSKQGVKVEVDVALLPYVSVWLEGKSTIITLTVVDKAMVKAYSIDDYIESGVVMVKFLDEVYGLFKKYITLNQREEWATYFMDFSGDLWFSVLRDSRSLEDLWQEYPLALSRELLEDGQCLPWLLELCYSEVGGDKMSKWCRFSVLFDLRV